jgi:hypothetical protein
VNTQDAQMDAALHRHQEAMKRLTRSNVDSARLRWGASRKSWYAHCTRSRSSIDFPYRQVIFSRLTAEGM